MRPLATLLTAFYLLVANTLSFPVLSEFMASNESTLPDEDGDFPDWIEIANMGNAALDLAGYHLTDNQEELTRWTFPPISLAAGSRLVVFASGKDRTNPSSELHTDFQLDAGGEYLALVAPDGITIATDPQRKRILDGAWGDRCIGVAIELALERHRLLAPQSR